jgi:UDP-N-acetylmuramoyl-tripeptide--D-alanyl-D-alanine ligase
MFRAFIQNWLERSVKKYLQKHQPKLVVITGSVGKTSTKLAIATVLSEHYRVRTHEGNHNTHLSAPLAILGVEFPDNIHSMAAWFNVWRAIGERMREPTDVDVIVQELGTDQPGDVAHFGGYLRPDVAVVTAVSPEHMEFFKTMDAVAQEELSVAGFSELTVVNRDDIDEGYARFASTNTIDTYGLREPAEYRVVLDSSDSLEGRMGRLIAPEWGEVPITLQLVGDQGAKAAAAAVVVGAKLGLTPQQVAVGISKLQPVPGRMQVLRGLDKTTLIDDTYNSSPLAISAAMQVLYATEASQRIVILGSMNELGDASAQAHKQAGELCDSTKLAWVVTIGEEAKKYLAPAASNKGCQVRSFASPYEAGAFVHSVLQPGTVVLAKGSQNGVFAEEALKVLLHDADDEVRLVRQSPYWMAVKNKQFSPVVAED